MNPPVEGPGKWTNLKGSSLVFLGAILFSAKAIMVKLAYRHEVDSISLLALRMAFSLPIFLLVAWYSNRKFTNYENSISKKDWMKIAFFGFAGYYLASLFDFIGLQYITAGLERLILFMYPTIVVLISVYFGQRISRAVYIALALTYVGIAIAFWGSANTGGSTNLALGAFLIFLAAFAFAVYIYGSGTLLPKIGTLRYTSLAMSVAGLAILIHHLILYQLRLFHFVPQVYFLAVLMAVFSTALPSFLVSEGIRLIGSNRAAVVGSIGPISTITLAYIFLNEKFGGLEILGTILVIAGVLLISLRK